MVIVDIVPKDIVVKLELSVEEVKNIVDALDSTVIHTTAENKQAVTFLLETFFPEMNHLLENIERMNL